MATKATAKAAPAPPAPELLADEPMGCYWVTDPSVPGLAGRTGIIALPVSSGQPMVDLGSAQDMFKEDGMSLRYRRGEEPLGHPPVALPVVVAIWTFTAAIPAVLQFSAIDRPRISNGLTVRLRAKAGDAGAIGAIEGFEGEVSNLTGTTFELEDLDLSLANVTGLMADATVVP